jgi:hypothetical protein
MECTLIRADLAKGGLTALATDIISQVPFTADGGQFEFGVCALLALREIARKRRDAPIGEGARYHAPFHVFHLQRALELTVEDVFISEHRESESTFAVVVAISVFTARTDLTTIVVEFRDEFPSFLALDVVLNVLRKLCRDVRTETKKCTRTS